MNRLATVLPALLALAACDLAPVENRPSGPPPAPSKAPPAPPAETQPAEAPEQLAFVDETGQERLRLACLGDGRLQITVPGFEPIGSEDRLTLGAGDEAFAHVADLEAPGPGVTGGGPVDRDLLDRLARGAPVRAVYGAQSVGPLQANRPEVLAAFTERCRGGLAG